MDPIEENVKEVVSHQLGIDADKIANDAMLIDDLGADTLDQCEIVMEVEESLGVRIPSDDTWKVDTVGDLVEVARKAVASKSR